MTTTTTAPITKQRIGGALTRYRILAFATGVMLLLGRGPGHTEDYPSRPIRLVITTPAGSLVDVLGRLFAQDLGDRLGQTIVVDGGATLRNI